MASSRTAQDIINEDVASILKNHVRLPEPLRNAHIYLTGGTGFLGMWLLHLIAALNDKYDFNTRVTVASRSVDDFNKKYPHLASRKEFTFFVGDVRMLIELPQDVTHIIHAAAVSDKNDFATDPVSAFENNIDSTMHIFRLALQLGSLQNILLMSSSMVYGKQPADVLSIKEDSYGASRSPFDINSIYSESKRACESVASAFLSEIKLPVTIARPFSFVGPGQSLDLPWAVTDFMREALKGSPIKIMSDGSVVRSVMYASDFANWILHIAAYGQPRSVYNVGSPEAVDILSLARMIRAHFKVEPQIMTSLGNSHPANSRVVPDVSKAMNDLQLKMTVSLQDAITRSLEWHGLSA